MFFKRMFVAFIFGTQLLCSQNNSSLSATYSVVSNGTHSEGYLNNSVNLKYQVNKINNKITNSLLFSSYKMNYASDEIVNNQLLDLSSYKVISYTIGYASKLKNNWSYSIMATPTIASNFESPISLNSLFLNGELLFSKNYSHSTLNFGILRNTHYGNNYPIPVLNFEGNISNNVSFVLGYPYTKINYGVNNTNALGISISPEGFLVNVGNNSFNEAAAVETAKFKGYNTSIYFSHCIDEFWKIEFNAGYQFNNNYKLLDKNLNTVHQFSIQNSFIAGVSLKYNLLNDKS